MSGGPMRGVGRAAPGVAPIGHKVTRFGHIWPNAASFGMALPTRYPAPITTRVHQ